MVSFALVVAVVALGSFSAGSNPIWLLHFPSFVVVGVLPFLVVSVVLGFGEMRSAFSAAVKKCSEKSEIARALVFFDAFGKRCVRLGLLGLVSGAVSFFMNFGDTAAIGPNIGLMLMSLYAGFVHIAVIIPLTAILKKRLE